MTQTAMFFLGAAGACAVADWAAVASGKRRWEYLFKPLTMLLLVVTAVALEPANDAQRGWFVAALSLSLVGDVFLMLPADRFVQGLAAFLLAHLAYIGGFWTDLAAGVPLYVGAAVVTSVTLALIPRVLLGIRDRRLKAPVAIYATVISVMVASAIGTSDPRAAVGAAIFYVSDLTIAWNRFVTPLAWAPVVIMMTYHVGQAALVLSLVG